MFNKKIIIIIISAAIIFFASAILVFFLVKRDGSKLAVNKISPNITDVLKSNHPEFSSAQLQFYADTAAKGSVAPCQGRADENACVTAVAFIKGDRNFCNVLYNKDKKLYKECANDILKVKASEEISQCAPLSGDDYYNCLGAIFSIYSGLEDCAGLPDSGARSVCQDFFNYQAVYSKYDRGLCQTIKTEKLNQYCLNVIIDKNQDTDGDGLTDLDEINKYQTSYLSADTDGDGLSDGDEVKKYGTNPLNPDTNGDGIKDGEAVRRGLIKVK